MIVFFVGFSKEELQKRAIKGQIDEADIIEFNFYAFDKRYVIYATEMLVCPRKALYSQFSLGYNLCLTTNRHSKLFDRWSVVGVHDRIRMRNSMSEYLFPLYLYNVADNRLTVSYNIRENIYDLFTKQVGPDVKYEEIFYYIYGVLYDPVYREKYAEDLLYGFPRIPIPHGGDDFRLYVSYGNELISYHLLKHQELDKHDIGFPVSGSNIIESSYPKYNNGKVFINKHQYFENIPIQAWEFEHECIKPCQKWLKVRKGRALTNEDILYYMKVVYAIKKTIELMNAMREKSMFKS